MFCGLSLTDDVEVVTGNHAVVAILNQQPAVDPFEVAGRCCRAPIARGQQTNIFLACHSSSGFGRYRRCNDHFDKLLIDNRLCGVSIKLPVERNDATEC